jgi:hypothetical protein
MGRFVRGPVLLCQAAVPDSDPASFVDPVLKDAVIRAWGQVVAPPGLAERVRSAMSSAADAPLRLDARPGWRTWGGLGLAAAAVLAIVIGYTQFLPGPAGSSPGAGNAMIAGSVPVSLVRDVITTHDRCSLQYLANHHNVGCDKSDYGQIRQRLEDRLGYRVWATPVAGWEFRGAADCRIGDGATASAHLLYERPAQKQTLSVFSVPHHGQCSSPPPAGTFAQEVENHPVAGFVEGQELYCLVGFSPDHSLTVDEVKRTTETYRSNLHALHIAYPQFPGLPTQLAHSSR